MSDDNKTFKKKCFSEISKQSKDKNFIKLTDEWFSKSVEHNYSYHFDWLGRPVIQYPQDLILIQQIIWKVKPDLIIETGGLHEEVLYYLSLVFSNLFHFTK